MLEVLKKYDTSIFTALIWAGYYFFVSLASKEIDPLTVGFIIRLIAFFILLIIISFTDGVKSLKASTKAFMVLIIIGLNGFMLDYTAFRGFEVANSAVGTLLLKSDVIMVNVASAMVDRQKFTVKDWLFTFLTLFGVFLVLDIKFFDLTIFEVRNLYFILSALFVTFNVFIIRFVQRRYGIINSSIGFCNNAIAMVCFLLGMLISKSSFKANILEAINSSIYFLIPAAVAQSFIYIFYYRSLEKYPIWIVKIVLLLIPVFNMIINFLIFRNGINVKVLMGAFLVIGGAGAILYLHREPTGNHHNLAYCD